MCFSFSLCISHFDWSEWIDWDVPCTCLFKTMLCGSCVPLVNKTDNGHLSICLQPSFLPSWLLSWVLEFCCYKQACFKPLSNIGSHRMHFYSGVFTWPLEPKNCPFLCCHYGQGKTGSLISSAKPRPMLRTTSSQWYPLITLLFWLPIFPSCHCPFPSPDFFFSFSFINFLLSEFCIKMSLLSQQEGTVVL